ncbi:hypothetical protein NE236_25565 [Actinoallomurus purpureus]|nr:hypothetical protein [Actinoallomurus purpureus]
MRGRQVIFPASAAFLIAGLAATALLPSGTPSLVTGPLVPTFALVTPAFCTARLLARLDRAARVIVAGAAAIALNATVAEMMLVCSIWSPRGGLIAVAAVCTVPTALAVAISPNRGNSPGMRQADVTNPDDGDESWAFDR